MSYDKCMSLTRAGKQAMYAIGCIGVAALAAALLLIIIIRPRPVLVATPTPTVPPVQLEQVSVIPHEPRQFGDQRTVDVVARLRNPNPRLGVAEYSLTFHLRNRAGQEILAVSPLTYLLPGAVQYVAAINVAVPEPVGSVEATLPGAPPYQVLPNGLEVPTFSVFPRERQARSIGEVVIEEQKGIVSNPSPFAWEQVDIIGVALGPQGEVVGVGQTSVGALEIGEQREFFLQWPRPSALTERVILTASANVFRQGNLQPLPGDPNTLR